MSPERLLKHFEQISEAPDAVPRLRRFILDLAVRGKIVEHDPADEPAAEVLKRVGAKKAEAVRSGEIRKQRPLRFLDESDLPFKLPYGWQWVRLGEVSMVITKGSTPTSYGHSYVPQGINFIKVEAIRGGKLSPETVTSHISQETHEFLKRSQLEAGDFLFSIAGSIGTCAIVSEAILPANTNQALAIIRGSNAAFLTSFLQYAASSSLVESALARARGGAMNNISLEDVSNFALPLPPLAEQHRTVAKVDELMALCDKLEAAQARREKRRDRLVASTLHGLNNGNASPEPGSRPTFEDSARFYFNHIPRLTTRPEHIHQLRQTILNLAVRGKLVPQDPNDEPAIELLRKIETRKLRMVREGKIRKQRPFPSIGKDETIFEIPQSWQRVRLGNYFILITDGTHATPCYTSSGVPFLSVNNIQGNRLTFQNCKFISQEEHEELSKRCRPEVGDVLLGKVGSIGVCDYIREGTPNFSIFVQLALLKSAPETLAAFSRFLILSPIVQNAIGEQASGTALKYIGIGKISNIVVPIPPIAEQRRIVAKVDKLIALCEELEKELAANTNARYQLLEATLQQGHILSAIAAKYK